MLRLLVVALVIGNALFFSWSQGWLDQLSGLPSKGDREPQRLAQQVHPERVRLLAPAASAGSAAGGAASASSVATAASATGDSASGPAGAASAAAALAAANAAASAATRAATTHAASGPGAAASAVGKAPTPTTPATTSTAGGPAGGPAGARPAAAPAPAPGPAASAALPASAPAKPAASAPGAATAASRPAQGVTPLAAAACLEAGPFSATETSVAESALRNSLGAGAWTRREAEGPGEWMVYMGPYPDDDWLDRKKAELARIRGGVKHEDVTSPAELARGLSLGRFNNKAAAEGALNQFRTRGIRTARVVKSGAGPAVTYVRVAPVDAATAARLAGVKLPQARGFGACSG